MAKLCVLWESLACKRPASRAKTTGSSSASLKGSLLQGILMRPVKELRALAQQLRLNTHEIHFELFKMRM